MDWCDTFVSDLVTAIPLPLSLCPDRWSTTEKLDGDWKTKTTETLDSYPRELFCRGRRETCPGTLTWDRIDGISTVRCDVQLTLSVHFTDGQGVEKSCASPGQRRRSVSWNEWHKSRIICWPTIWQQLQMLFVAKQFSCIQSRHDSVWTWQGQDILGHQCTCLTVPSRTFISHLLCHAPYLNAPGVAQVYGRYDELFALLCIASQCALCDSRIW